MKDCYNISSNLILSAPNSDYNENDEFQDPSILLAHVITPTMPQVHMGEKN